MSFSKLKLFLRSPRGGYLVTYLGALGAATIVVFNLQQAKNLKDRKKTMSQEEADSVLKKYGMMEEKEKQRENLMKFKKKVKVEDKYEFVKIPKMDRESLEKSIQNSKGSSNQLSIEKRLAQSYTQVESMKANTNMLMYQLKKRLSGGATGPVKYSAFREFDELFTNSFVEASIILNEVNAILNCECNKACLKMGNDIKKDLEKLIELIQRNLDDIKTSKKKLLEVKK